MRIFIIKEISNGWLLGGESYEESRWEKRELFLPTIEAVSEALINWKILGFLKAFAKARSKYGGKHGKE